MFFTLMAIYFLRQRGESSLKETLGKVLAFWAFLFWKDLPLMTETFHRSEFFKILFMSVDMWAVVSCAFYVIELLRPHSLSLKRILLHIIPYLSFTLLYAITGNYFVFILNGIWAAAYSGFIIFYLSREIRLYNRMLQNNYSNLEYIDIKWLRTATGLLFCCLCIWLYACYRVSWIGDAIYYCSAILLWGVICYYSDRQKAIDLQEDTYANSSEEMPEKNSYTFIPQLKYMLEEKCIFQNSGLTIMELSKMLGTNRTYLSDYLNNNLNTNFYDFINSYRIEHAERILSDPCLNLTVEEIAERSGFNSISTFRRAFEKKHHCTPLQYKKQYQNFPQKSLQTD